MNLLLNIGLIFLTFEIILALNGYNEVCTVVQNSDGKTVDSCDDSKFLVCTAGRCQCQDPDNQIYTFKMVPVPTTEGPNISSTSTSNYGPIITINRSRRSPKKGGSSGSSSAKSGGKASPKSSSNSAKSSSTKSTPKYASTPKYVPTKTIKTTTTKSAFRRNSTTPKTRSRRSPKKGGSTSSVVKAATKSSSSSGHKYSGHKSSHISSSHSKYTTSTASTTTNAQGQFIKVYSCFVKVNSPCFVESIDSTTTSPSQNGTTTTVSQPTLNNMTSDAILQSSTPVSPITSSLTPSTPSTPSLNPINNSLTSDPLVQSTTPISPPMLSSSTVATNMDLDTNTSNILRDTNNSDSTTTTVATHIDTSSTSVSAESPMEISTSKPAESLPVSPGLNNVNTTLNSTSASTPMVKPESADLKPKLVQECIQNSVCTLKPSVSSPSMSTAGDIIGSTSTINSTNASQVVGEDQKLHGVCSCQEGYTAIKTDFELMLKITDVLSSVASSSWSSQYKSLKENVTYTLSCMPN